MTRTTESAPSAQQRLRRIEGRHNALVKELRQAFARAERTEDGSCAIEGLRIVEEATRSGLRFRAVFFKESAQNLAERLLPQIGANVDTLLLPDKLFDATVPSETPQGVAALVRLKEFSLADVLERLQVGPSSYSRACRTPAIWGRSCAQPKPLAARESCSARAR
jgi:tRNA G18 (ribose-2'-O)-methylase SpoU